MPQLTGSVHQSIVTEVENEEKSMVGTIADVIFKEQIVEVPEESAAEAVAEAIHEVIQVVEKRVPPKL